MAYRGWKSPEALDTSYRPERAPVGAATIRRIINGNWQEQDDFTLLRLDGMLKLPPRCLAMVRAGDVDGIKRLEFAGDDAGVRQLILDELAAPGAARKSQPRRRRAQ